MDDIPDTWMECGQMLEGILLAACEGKLGGDRTYRVLRQQLMSDGTLKPLLPDFVRTMRDLSAFWAFIKDKFGQYAPRRKFVREAFVPLYDHLEGINRAPVDEITSDVLSKFDPDGVHAVWEKALARRVDDPEGAITSARTLLETVCKRILDASEITYDDTADLPSLYRSTSMSLNLAPSQHTEDTFKRILGGATTVVESLGSLRNKIGDAHGKGGFPVRVSPRHAELAVNLAGAIATFLVQTWLAREEARAKAPVAAYKSTVIDIETEARATSLGDTEEAAIRTALDKLPPKQP